MASLTAIGTFALAHAAKSSSKCVGCIRQIQCARIQTKQAQTQHGDTVEEIALTLKGSRLHESSLQAIQQITATESSASAPIKQSKVSQKMEESRIAKILREDKARVLREQEFREVHDRVRDAMANPLPFIVQKLKSIREMQLKESKKRQLEKSYKTAMEAAAKGDTSKISLLDASFV